MGSQGCEKSSDLLKCAEVICGRDSKSPQLSHVALLWSEVQDHFCLGLALLPSILKDESLLAGEPSIIQRIDMV